jgi:hypothetical protein
MIDGRIANVTGAESVFSGAKGISPRVGCVGCVGGNKHFGPSLHRDPLLLASGSFFFFFFSSLSLSINLLLSLIAFNPSFQSQ